jgi:hypothetical protein
MSNNLVINSHPAPLNYSGQLPFVSLRKGIRTSQNLIFFYSKLFRVAKYQGGVEPRRCRAFSPAQLNRYFTNTRTEGIRTSQKLIIFYSKLFKEMMMGRVEPRRCRAFSPAQLNRFLVEMQSNRKEDSILIRFGCALP